MDNANESDAEDNNNTFGAAFNMQANKLAKKKEEKAPKKSSGLFGNISGGLNSLFGGSANT